jgi:glutamine amidotransferase
MCRWMAYMGNAQLLSDVLFSEKHSIVMQSLTSFEGAEPTNGDGFGVGWYSPEFSDEPALYRTVEPAWHDRNMQDMSKLISSGTIFAHVRAASPNCGYVQQTNCHPFRYKNWLFMHNGVIRSFKLIKRELWLKIDPVYFNEIMGTTDSETFFYLALTFGLVADPVAAMTKTVAYIEEVARSHGATNPIQMTVCCTNGKSNMWAFRYSSEKKSRTLYYSSDRATVLELHPDHPQVRRFSDDARFIVSEPLGNLPGVWNLVPESSCVVVKDGSLEVFPFEPSQ